MQAAQIKLDEVPLDQKRYLASFYGFAKEFLRLPIYDRREPRKVCEVRDTKGNLLYVVNETGWQREVLEAMDPHGAAVTLRASNGGGKTSVIIPGVVFPHMTLFPNSRTVITSGVDRQVKEQVFPALHAHAPKFRGWSFSGTRIEAPNGAVCLGFSTDDGGKFEGWHGNKEELYALSDEKRRELEEKFQAQLRELTDFMTSGKGPLLIIVDEAKSVRPEIFDAIERCTWQRKLLISSPGPAEGEFYKSHHENAPAYTARVQVGADQCPHADHAANARLIETRGRNDPLVKSKVFAEFMTKPGDTVIDRATVDLAMRESGRLTWQPGRRKLMCDFAAGGDENVLAERNGNRVTLPRCWRETDTMKACGEFIVEFRKLGLTQADCGIIYGDNDGLGKVMIDCLHKLGWPIQRVHNNAEPALAFKDHYSNRSAEVWWEGGKKVSERQFILPNDDILAGQLASRHPDATTDGKLAVESKKKMKARGVTSPDRADAVLEVMRDEPSVDPIQFAGGDGRDLSLFDRLMAEKQAEAPVFAGAQCE